jgi:hypothetical protein
MKFAEPSKLNRNPGGWGTRLFVVFLLCQTPTAA